MTSYQQSHQKGNVLFLILVAVVLFAALSFALTGSGGGQQANSAVAERMVANLRGQIDVVRAAFQECALSSPTPATASNYSNGLPLAYNSGTTSYAANTALPLADVRCDKGGGMTPLFTGTTMLGQMPNGLPAWQYTNNTANDVFFRTSLTATQSADLGIRGALTRLQAIYSASEATIVNNGTAATITICLRNNDATCGS